MVDDMIQKAFDNMKQNEETLEKDFEIKEENNVEEKDICEEEFCNEAIIKEIELEHELQK